MTRRQRLRRIVDLADTATQRAALEVSTARAELEQKQEQLDQFRSYLSDYEHTLAAGTPCMNVAQAREVKRFILQLEQAIDALETSGDIAHEKFAQTITDWQFQSHRGRALADIAERESMRLDRRDELVQQSELDDTLSKPR